MVLGFLLVQCLDGVFTYLGRHHLGPSGGRRTRSSARPWRRRASGAGLAGAKLVAVGLGIALHLAASTASSRCLTAIYVARAILPWTAMFLSSQ